MRNALTGYESLRLWCSKVLGAGADPRATTEQLMGQAFGRLTAAFDSSDVVVVSPGDDLQAKIDAAGAGKDVTLATGTYAPPTDITAPTGVNLIGPGTNCILDANLILEGTANARGIAITYGHYVERNGVKYYV